MMRKRFPIGHSSLACIRTGGYYYVDKTPQIVQLLTTSFYVFLSRPRRFGKSLMLDTIAELFSGNRKLFEGLYAEHHWDWEQTYPVIRFSFASEFQHGKVDSFRFLLQKRIQENAERLGVTLDEQELSHGLMLAFYYLIDKVRQKYGKKVVVLIDEYDKPIWDNIDTSPEVISQIRNILSSFYSVIKAQGSSIRFALLTGVSNIMASTFDGVNNVVDITLHQRYSSLCGFTQAELEKVFATELEGVDLKLLSRWYFGYNWTGESVYNPFGILLFLSSDKTYQSHWIMSGGSMELLFDTMKQNQNFLLSVLNAQSACHSTIDLDRISILPLMFQTGYLTIKESFPDSMGQQVTYQFPNREVRLALSRKFLRYWTREWSVSHYCYELSLELGQGNMEEIKRLIYEMIRRFPTDCDLLRSERARNDFWLSVFLAFLAASCAEFYLEDTGFGCSYADMVVINKDYAYVFEFKMAHSGDAASALAQIKEKNYAEKYRATAKQIYEIGVSFDAQTRELEFALAD